MSENNLLILRGPGMNKRRRIYEGKAKVLYEGPEPGTLIQHFKDDATAFNAKKHALIEGKGVLNNRISEYVFVKLGEIGVPTHFIKRLNMREQLIREVEIVPLEVVVRNVAAGSLSTRLGLEEGAQLPRSIIEFYYKKDELNDPMVSEEHITAFGWATPQEIDEIMQMALRINDFLVGLFLGIEEGTPLPRSIIEFYYKKDELNDPMVAEEHITAFNWASTQEIDDIMALTLRINDYLFGMFGAVGIKLVDFKLEFGRLYDNEQVRIVLADEISPDCCRLWDIQSGDKLDKDRFRRDLGGLLEAYTEVAKRLGIMAEGERPQGTGPVLVKG